MSLHLANFLLFISDKLTIRFTMLITIHAFLRNSYVFDKSMNCKYRIAFVPTPFLKPQAPVSGIKVSNRDETQWICVY